MDEELVKDTVVESSADLTTNLTTDLSDEEISKILELLEECVFYLQAISEGSATIIVYGLIVAPLLILTMMLWWFFKQFIYKYS